MFRSRTMIAWTLAASMAFFSPAAALGDAAEPSLAQDEPSSAENLPSPDRPQEDPEVDGSSAAQKTPGQSEIAPAGENENGGESGSETPTARNEGSSGLGENAGLEGGAESRQENDDREDDASPLDGQDVPEGAYVIASSLAGEPVLDVDGASVDNGTNVQVWEDNGTNAQRFWISYDAESEAFRVQSMHSGKALDLSAGGVDNGTNIQQWLLDRATPNQLWEIVDNGNGTVSFVSCTSGLVLDVAGASSANATNVQAWEENGTAAQQFVLESVNPLQDGVYALRSTLDSSLSLDVRDSSRTEGAGLQIWERTDVTAQKFSFECQDDGSYLITALCSGMALECSGSSILQAPAPSADGQVEDASFLWRAEPGDFGISLVNVETGLAMDVSGGNPSAGTPVGGWEENRTRAQGFFPTPTTLVSPGTYLVRCASDGRVLDVDGASFSNGTNVQLWSDNGTGAQRWEVSVRDDGGIVLKNARSRLALDVRNYGIEPGTNVQQWTPTADNSAQTFYPVPSGDGWFYLKSACSGLYLDAAGGGGYDGANVQVWTPNQTNAQKFAFEYAPWTFTTSDARASISQAPMQWGITSFGGYTPSQAVAGRLQQAVDRARAAGVEVSVLMCDLFTGQGITVNGDARIYSASSSKGPYVASVAGTNPWAATAWANTMRPTITVSSNDDYAALYNAFGPAPLWEWCARAGIDGRESTGGHYPFYSARELSLLWTANYDLFTTTDEGRSISPWYVKPLNSSIGANLGGRYLTWSKPGWIGLSDLHSTNDAGVVWSDEGPYVVALLTDAYADFGWHADILWALEAAHEEMTASM